MALGPKNDLREAVDQLLRLRHLEGSAPAELRADIASVSQFLQDSVGKTVRPASAARLLGVSQTALSHWLEKGDIASVLTPDGRREIPLGELLDLYNRIRNLGARTTRRPLSLVLRERRADAEGSIVLDRLLPPRSRRGHRAAELHALAYHRLVAERLDDTLVEGARRRLAGWTASNGIHPRWAEEWDQILTLPLRRIASAISADTPRGRELRQTSPFSGALNEHERQRLVEAVKRRVSA
jgi:hypothetical protein